mmetsp:Transcript_126264/g.232525  ORF Transcript_126264/g.232525 Transcript_126264/m.232525 type:complete len:461 (-) Transcript_126264:140-1522(-)
MGGCLTQSRTASGQGSNDRDRMRLTVGGPGTIAPGGSSASTGEAGDDDGDRGFMKQISSEELLHIISDVLDVHGDGEDGLKSTKSSMVSRTDQDGEKRDSFASKTVQQLGEPMDPSKSGIGFACRKGMKPEHPNQDSWMVVQVEGAFSVYAVFDGHGLNGHHISDYVKDILPKILLQDPRFKTNEIKRALEDSFSRMQTLIVQATKAGRLDAERSGTTATVVVHDHVQSKITVAHVGDSLACLARLQRKGTGRDLLAVPLTQDHRPEEKRERTRIEKAGGCVSFDGCSKHRVYVKDQPYPGLNMSRCLGDLLGHREAGLSCQPDISQHQLKQEDLLLLICSDGVWEFVSPEEAVGCYREAIPAVHGAAFRGSSRFNHWNRATPPSAMGLSERLARMSWDRWLKEVKTSVDDITVVAVLLQESTRTSTSSATAAGAGQTQAAATKSPPAEGKPKGPLLQSL